MKIKVLLSLLVVSVAVAGNTLLVKNKVKNETVEENTKHNYETNEDEISKILQESAEKAYRPTEEELINARVSFAKGLIRYTDMSYMFENAYVKEEGQ